MKKMQAPKGTFDILPYSTQETWKLSSLWQELEQVIREVTKDYGYLEIRTPIYESTELFDRGAGETSDIVTKEMFTFKDRGDRSISLRPEGTAAVMRSMIENHMVDRGGLHKLYYVGPMFRYERPQSGRYRQHHQFGIEVVGTSSFLQDVEVMDLLLELYRRVGLKNTSLLINSVGDIASRSSFKEALLQFLTPHLKELSADSQLRFEKNPLRILDSKDPNDRKILENAPSILDFLSPEAKKHFDAVCRSLDALKIPYTIDPCIVRGLDYYNHTVFEIVSKDLGSQATVGAGGRYDGLLKTFGGPDLPSVGCATGMERLLQVMIAQKESVSSLQGPVVYFVGLDEATRQKAFELASSCRHARIEAQIELGNYKLQNGLQNAVKMEAQFCAILGRDEMDQGKIQIKDLKTRDSFAIDFSEMIPFFQDKKRQK